MKKSNLSGLMIGVFLLLYCQNALAYRSGRVVDAVTGEPVKGAHIFYHKTYTDAFPPFGADYYTFFTCPNVVDKSETQEDGTFTLTTTDLYLWPTICSPGFESVTIYKEGYYLGFESFADPFQKEHPNVTKEGRKDPNRLSRNPLKEPPTYHIAPQDDKWDPCEQWMDLDLKRYIEDDSIGFSKQLSSLEKASETHVCNHGLRLIWLAKDESISEEDKLEVLSQMAKILDAHPKVVNYHNSYTGGPALHWSLYRDTRRSKLLIARGADVNLTDNKGESPLMSAIKGIESPEEALAMVRLLISKGADPSYHSPAPKDNCTTDGYGVIHWAAIGGLNEIIGFLLDIGIPVDDRSIYNLDTPLSEAVDYNKDKTTEYLLSKGADVNAKNRLGETPLIKAATRGAKACVEILLLHGADVETKDN